MNEENQGNVAPQQGMEPAPSNSAPSLGNHPSQAHADHAAIMHAHGIINHPERMAAVHALHHAAGAHMGADEFYKGKMNKFMAEEKKEKAPSGAPEHPSLQGQE